MAIVAESQGLVLGAQKPLIGFLDALRARDTGGALAVFSLNRPNSPKRPRRVPLVAGVFFGHHGNFWISALLI
jgi:hypothetical protein